MAERAGISVDWYTRLEQGRGSRPSATTIAALARALRLNETEHAHLLALCGSLRPPRFKRESVSESLGRAVHGFGQFAYVMGLRWDVLAWNAPAQDLFGFGDMAVEDRNILVFALTSPAARRVFGSDWAEQAKRVLAKFRVTYDLWAADPAFEELTARLHCECPHFAEWWHSHDVRGAAGSRKTLHLSDESLVRFDFTTFHAAEDPAMQLVVLVPVSAPAVVGGHSQS